MSRSWTWYSKVYNTHRHCTSITRPWWYI